MYPETCPNCKADLKGPNVYEKFLEEYGDEARALEAAARCGHTDENPKFFWRAIGIEVQGGYDGISYWKCPDCGHQWDRDGFKDGVYCPRKDRT